MTATGVFGCSFGVSRDASDHDEECAGHGIQAAGLVADMAMEPYNFYRFTAKRYDPANGTYDQGFRSYDPGLNQFLTRDLYTGALDDLNLATDPFTNNRYSFAAGNPTTLVDLDGHAVTPDNPVTGNPKTNVMLNTTWASRDRFVGCACSGLDQEVQAARKAQQHRNPLQTFGNAVAGVGRGLVSFVEQATPMGQANVALNNPVAAMVTRRIPVVRDVADWVAENQASGAYDQAVKTVEPTRPRGPTRAARSQASSLPPPSLQASEEPQQEPRQPQKRERMR